MKIPVEMSERPTHEGLAIPYVTVISEGIPAFRAFDEEKREECILERKCGCCGQDLPAKKQGWLAFISGPKSMQSGRFFDPPMHVECAKYAMYLDKEINESPMDDLALYVTNDYEPQVAASRLLVEANRRRKKILWV